MLIANATCFTYFYKSWVLADEKTFVCDYTLCRRLLSEPRLAVRFTKYILGAHGDTVPFCCQNLVAPVIIIGVFQGLITLKIWSSGAIFGFELKSFRPRYDPTNNLFHVPWISRYKKAWSVPLRRVVYIPWGSIPCTCLQVNTIQVHTWYIRTLILQELKGLSTAGQKVQKCTDFSAKFLKKILRQYPRLPFWVCATVPLCRPQLHSETADFASGYGMQHYSTGSGKRFPGPSAALSDRRHENLVQLSVKQCSVVDEPIVTCRLSAALMCVEQRSLSDAPVAVLRYVTFFCWQTWHESSPTTSQFLRVAP